MNAVYTPDMFDMFVSIMVELLGACKPPPDWTLKFLRRRLKPLLLALLRFMGIIKQPRHAKVTVVSDPDPIRVSSCLLK
jgi:hypothetical protein